MYEIFRHRHSYCVIVVFVPRVLLDGEMGHLEIHFLTFCVRYRAPQAASLLEKWVHSHCSVCLVQAQQHALKRPGPVRSPLQR